MNADARVAHRLFRAEALRAASEAPCAVTLHTGRSRTASIACGACVLVLSSMLAMLAGGWWQPFSSVQLADGEWAEPNPSGPAEARFTIPRQRRVTQRAGALVELIDGRTGRVSPARVRAIACDAVRCIVDVETIAPMRTPDARAGRVGAQFHWSNHTPQAGDGATS